MKQNLKRTCWDILFKHFKHPDFLVRAEAARLAGALGDAKAVPVLIRMLKEDRKYTKVTAVYALGEIGDMRAVPLLEKISQDPLTFDNSGMYGHDIIRIAAALALLGFNNGQGIKNIEDLILLSDIEAFYHIAPAILALNGNSQLQPLKNIVSFSFLEKGLYSVGIGVRARVKSSIMQALGYIKTTQALAYLKEHLQDLSPYIRTHAARSLLRHSHRQHVSLLKNMHKKDKSTFVKVCIARMLFLDDENRYRKTLMAGMRDKDYFVRATALDAIAEVGDATLAKKVLPLLKDDHFYTRLCAIEALEKLGYEDAGPHIKKMLKHEHPRVAMQAAKYFIGLTHP